MAHERSTSRTDSGHRRRLLALLAVLAMLPAACAKPEVLQTISCPVYQPPQTPQPDWPRQCGGTR